MNKFQARFIELVLKKVIDGIEKIKTSFSLKTLIDSAQFSPITNMCPPSRVISIPGNTKQLVSFKEPTMFSNCFSSKKCDL